MRVVMMLLILITSLNANALTVNGITPEEYGKIKNELTRANERLDECDLTNKNLLEDNRNFSTIILRLKKDLAVCEAKKEPKYLFMPASFWEGVCTGIVAGLILGAHK